MDQDERCCGSGTCLINDEGLCWCGQQWNGATMCHPDAPEGIAPAAGPHDPGGAQDDTS